MGSDTLLTKLDHIQKKKNIAELERKKERKAHGNKRRGQARVAVTGPGAAPGVQGGQIGLKAQLEKIEGVQGLATVATSQSWTTSSNPIAAAQATMTISKAASTRDDIDLLLSLINQISMSDNSEDPGKIGTVLITSTKRDIGWIIDFGASDHMTYDASLFYHMTSSSKE